MGLIQHIHYGDWTIEWGEYDRVGHRVWISSNLPRPGRGETQVYTYFVSFFESPEMGVYRCKQIIDLVEKEQRRLIDRIATEYLESLKPEIPKEEAAVVYAEDSPEIPF
jgi:hypothetical protein